jgi:hypothetical protein
MLNLNERRRRDMNFTDNRSRIKHMASSFPAEFGLRAFPGKVFHIDLSASYVDDNEQVQLYVYTSEGLAFAKGTRAELKAQIVETVPRDHVPEPAFTKWGHSF